MEGIMEENMEGILEGNMEENEEKGAIHVY